MKRVSALAYMGISATNLSEWHDFAARLLGTQMTRLDSDTSICRIDERAFRIGVKQGNSNDLAYVGWEVADEAALDAVYNKLLADGRAARVMTEAEARSRFVAAGIAAQDPNGLPTEIVVGPIVSGTPPVSPIGASFVTGDLGLGHIVLYVNDLSESMTYYCYVLGFAITDRIRVGNTEVIFLHCNGRHHSLALVSGRTSKWLQHFMLEVDSIDTVGRTFDRCEAENRAQSTLGRHTNDLMLSFYAQPPECSYTIEYGHGGRILTEPVTVVSYEAASLWGHRDLLPGQL